MSSSTNDADGKPKSISGTKRKTTSTMFKSDQISATCRNTTGFNTTYAKLRSILMHPIGMLLTSILNNIPLRLIPGDFWTELLQNSTLNKDELLQEETDELLQEEKGEALQEDTPLPDLDYIFAAAMMKWDGAKEQQLTKNIHSYIDALSNAGRLKGFSDPNNANSVIFQQEKYAAGGKERKGGRVDFIISKKISDIDGAASMPAEMEEIIGIDSTTSMPAEMKKISDIDGAASMPAEMKEISGIDSSASRPAEMKEISGIDSTASMPAKMRSGIDSTPDKMKESGGIDSTASTPAKRSVVAIFEVGIHHDIWWKKKNQILKYVNSVRTLITSPFIIDQPILLTVMTVSKIPKKNADNTTSTGCSYYNMTVDERKALLLEFDGLKKPNKKMSVGNYPIQVRSAVFLCTPKDANDYRIALLWRKNTTCLKDASVQFGKILHAATVCAELRERFATMENHKYRYLGPNCCQIGNSVSVVAVFRYYSHKTN